MRRHDENDRVQREDAPEEGAHAQDAPPDDAALIVTLGSSDSAVTEFNELLDTVPDETEDPLDH